MPLSHSKHQYRPFALGPLRPRTVPQSLHKCKLPLPRSAQEASDGIPEYVFVKNKGWTHRNELKPGDECKVKGGDWAIYRPDLMNGGSVYVKDKGWIPEGELKPGDQYERDGVWVTFQPERVIKTTEEHPFFVKDKGWTPARELNEGDLLRTVDGWVPVSGLKNTGEWETVYNLRVADHHTYFVGAPEWGFAVWAHNAECAIVRPIKAAEREALQGTPLASSTHVVEYPGANGKTVSRFFANEGEAQSFVVLKRNELVASDRALSQATPIKAGVPDRTAPNPAITEEVRAWQEAQGFNAGKPGNGHTELVIKDAGGGTGLSDGIYAAGDYKKWEFVGEYALGDGTKRRVVIHYVKNNDTGAIAHFKIVNSQIVR